MTEKTWARIGLSLLFGLATFCVVALIFLAFAEQPRITLAVLFAVSSGLILYIYDVRSETPGE